MIDTLPEQVLDHLFKFLSVKDCLSLSRTNHDLNKIFGYSSKIYQDIVVRLNQKNGQDLLYSGRRYKTIQIDGNCTTANSASKGLLGNMVAVKDISLLNCYYSFYDFKVILEKVAESVESISFQYSHIHNTRSKTKRLKLDKSDSLKIEFPNLKKIDTDQLEFMCYFYDAALDHLGVTFGPYTELLTELSHLKHPLKTLDLRKTKLDVHHVKWSEKLPDVFNIRLSIPKHNDRTSSFQQLFKHSLISLDIRCGDVQAADHVVDLISPDLEKLECLKINFKTLTYHGDETLNVKTKIFSVKNLTITANIYQRFNDRNITADSEFTAFRRILKLVMAHFPNIENLTVNQTIPDEDLKYIYGKYSLMKDVKYV